MPWCGGSSGPSSPRIRAGAGAAPTPRAASARSSRARRGAARCPVRRRDDPPRPDFPTADAMSQLPEDKRLQFVPQEERPPMSPQLALRVAIIGTVALAIFAILFFRLWFLQVLSSDHYAKAASVNFVRPVEVAAPRGQILDRSGQSR